MSSIFEKLKFWTPIGSEGRQNLSSTPTDLKMVSKRLQQILVNLQLLFEPVLKAFCSRINNENMLGGTLCAPTPNHFKV